MKRPDTEKISLRMEKRWTEAESRIIQDIARRIQKSGKITSTADYQINRLKELGRSTEEIEKILKDAIGATQEEMYKLYDDVANWQYVRNKDLYEQINGEFIPPEDNEWLKQISTAAKEQTADELMNLAQSYGFSIMMGTKRVYMPFSEYYQKYVDAAVLDIIDGGFDYNTVIRRTVTQMTNSGLRTVDYASGRSMRTSAAVRRSVLTGVAQITGKVSEQNAAILGTNHYEVDWHPGARPEHRIWQGKVYSYEELKTVCGLGTVTGIHGANCYHDYYPFILGVSERLYTDEWLEAQNQIEAQTKIWNGREYDKYGQTQKQRQMETAMRAQREKVDALKAGGADPDEIMLARAKYQAQLDEYGRFCKKMGLEQQRERIYYDMRGRVAPSNMKYNKAAAVAKMNTNTPVKYNEKYDYSVKIKGYPDNVLEAISVYARKVAEKGSKDNLEHLYLINTKTGEKRYYEKGVENEVGGPAFWNFLNKHKNENFAFVHNHNTDGYFSETDMRTLLREKQIDVMIAVRNDAVIYVAEKGKTLPESGYFDPMFEKELNELNEKINHGEIAENDRAVEREKIIVDGLLKNHTKAGKLVEINGQR